MNQISANIGAPTLIADVGMLEFGCGKSSVALVAKTA